MRYDSTQNIETYLDVLGDGTSLFSFFTTGSSFEETLRFEKASRLMLEDFGISIVRCSRMKCRVTGEKS